MPAFYSITYLPDGRTSDFAGSRGNYYRLADGREIALRSAPAWCGRCREVTHGEVIEQVEEVDRRIAELEHLAAAVRREVARSPLTTADAPGDRHQREQIAEQRLRRAWRTARQSPPRCIVCGSIDITRLPCGETISIGEQNIRLEVIGLCSTDFNNWYFSSEGERIESMDALNR